MVLGQRGSIHTIVLGLVIIVGFGIALGWPQYQKHKTVASAQRALDLGKALAFAEATYKTQHGAYTPDFVQLGLALPCPVVRDGDKIEMECSDYVYRLEEGGVLRVQHKGLPKWFDLDLAKGSVDCSHEDGSIAGSHICSRVDLTGAAQPQFDGTN